MNRLQAQQRSLRFRQHHVDQLRSCSLLPRLISPAPSDAVFILAGLFVLFALLTSPVSAEVKPVGIRVERKEYWVGQRIPVFIELRAAGTFDGAASFSIPKIPMAVLVQVGNAVVSSEEKEGETWFVQTHEFAMFSQKDGEIEIPDFPVRFRSRQGFTGPSQDQTAVVPAVTVKIQRPPGSDVTQFLVTASSIDISESWNPQPGETQQGAIFTRTISQSAEQVTGMALAPPSETVPDGVRVYLAPPQVKDETTRGDFQGTRTDSIKYVFQSPGQVTLPAMKYIWWNPEKETFGEKSLPAVAFNVSAVEVQTASAGEEEASKGTSWSWWLALTIFLTSVWNWKYLHSILHGWWRIWNPDDRIYARKLVSACRKGRPREAELAWIEWQYSVNIVGEIEPELHTAILELEEVLYGQIQGRSWQGRKLESAFARHLQKLRQKHPDSVVTLPNLNL